MGRAERMRIAQRMSQHIMQLKLALRMASSAKNEIPIGQICLYHECPALSTGFFRKRLVGIIGSPCQFLAAADAVAASGEKQLTVRGK